MPLTPEQRKLLQQTLKIRGSHVPLHRVIDILATEEGDVAEAINRFRDINNADLRRAFHNCAVLLRDLERETGLAPSWEQPKPAAPSSSAASAPSSGSSAASSSKTAPAPATEKKEKKPKFRPEDLQTFEDESARGQHRVAKVFIDGASKGNPGDAGIGVALMTLDDKKIAQISQSIGTATNNIAEYSALLEALNLAKRMGVEVLHILSDSELLVKQMTGVYKIKNPDILQKAKEAQSRKKQFQKCTVNWVARENNTLADALSTAQLQKKAPAGAPPGMPSFEEEGADMMPNLDDLADEGSTD